MASATSERLSDLLFTGDNKVEHLIDKDGKTHDQTTLAGKVVGVYFSAHWCPPCRGFTPFLANVYNECKKANKPFEIVFVSSDTDEQAFKHYLDSMPWLAVPYSNREMADFLSAKFDIQGILPLRC